MEAPGEIQNWQKLGLNLSATSRLQLTAGQERCELWPLKIERETPIKLVSIYNWPIATVTCSSQKICRLSELHCITNWSCVCLSASNWQIISLITRRPSRWFLASHISYNVSEAGDQSGRLGPVVSQSEARKCVLQPMRGQIMWQGLAADCGSQINVHRGVRLGRASVSLSLSVSIKPELFFALDTEIRNWKL